MTDENEKDPLEILLAQSLEIQNQINKLRQERKKKEAEAEVTIRIRRLAGKFVFLRNEPYREDIVMVLKQIEGRSWRSSDKENAVPVRHIEKFLNDVQTLKNVKIVYDEGVEKDIHDYLYAPAFSCSLDPKYLKVKTSKQTYAGELRNIPGTDYSYQGDGFWKIPLGEGWRLYAFAEKQPPGTFIWEEDAQAFVLSQVEKRLKLDVVAKMTDIEMNVPGLINVTPRSFQKIGVEFFNVNGGRGILADEMGTGKTLQMIMLTLLKKWHTVVFCPATLKANWSREIIKFTGERPYILDGGTPTPHDVAYLIRNKPKFVIINYDIAGQSTEVKTETKDEHGYTHVSKETRYPWIEVINLVGFDLAVLDEGHYIKNVDSNRSKAARKIKIPNVISMTGTPLLNRPIELWPMLNLAAPEVFPSMENFSQQYTWNGKEARNVDELKTLLKPLMIRRLKKDVIKELPPINRINDYYELSPKGRKLYERVEAGLYDILDIWNPSEAGATKAVTNMLVQIMRMKQVCAIDAIEGTTDLATRIFDSTETGDRPKKVLIFSQFKPTTYAIRQRLGAEALGFVSRTNSGFVTADGNEQQKIIDQFQSDPSIHFLCVTEKTAKEGHNITEALAVIFNDLFWTPAGHQQAEGRAYGRVGDLHSIDSYYRVGVGTICEWIMELLAAKMNMIEQVIEGVEASRNGDVSIISELLAKMKEGMWTRGKK